MRWDLDFADYFNFWQTKTLFVFFSPKILFYLKKYQMGEWFIGRTRTCLLN
jgi:hypothetical protein